MKREDVEALAALARIELTDAEIETFSKEFDDILLYVDRVKGLAEGTVKEPQVGVLSNVFREDTDPHPPDRYTEDVLASAPLLQDRYIRVKKIIGQDHG